MPLGGADDEGNPGGVGHLVSPGVDPVMESTMRTSANIRELPNMIGTMPLSCD